MDFSKTYLSPTTLRHENSPPTHEINIQLSQAMPVTMINLPCQYNTLKETPLYANPKPSVPMVIAVNSADRNCSYDSYSGKSI
jgi:hypothetical protein